MWIEELETRLEEALQALERSVQQQQSRWRDDCHQWQQQLLLAKQREAQLASQIEQLLARMNAMDNSPERNPLLQKVKIISAHLDALAKEASAFTRSLP
ncbi:hypothetical protein Bresa_03187|uniref:Uncharacterized protein n=1 Tax=Brenneria salicis ATCC 15712 = DSM 30166 TaxID=714314 RepID=A0A366HXM4_9GAMM|nr:hypothetical protein [Brenneria salicis]NMN92842.1 hypothetical protein [Brenneria salicis ATCC 15712 = DSM 30166]RBP57265.1 hypothetical protein DES54_1728 [Brenneria salicis ATCC 15712 = DSM 30166]RLM28427.1 hypothetical protein BHG07_17300 [Brenneria salicis ATCC 15712 = DSM 30166]